MMLILVAVLVPTVTVVYAQATETPTATPTATLTLTPSVTPTPSNTPTPSPTATIDLTAMPATSTPTDVPTITASPTPTPTPPPLQDYEVNTSYTGHPYTSSSLDTWSCEILGDWDDILHCSGAFGVTTTDIDAYAGIQVKSYVQKEWGETWYIKAAFDYGSATPYEFSNPVDSTLPANDWLGSPNISPRGMSYKFEFYLPDDSGATISGDIYLSYKPLDDIELDPPPTCADEFMFDPAEDWFASALVDADRSSTMVIDPLYSEGFESSGEYGTVFYIEQFFADELNRRGLYDWIDWLWLIAEDHPPAQRHEFAPGNWYAVQVAHGEWLDDNTGDPRFDLEFAWATRKYKDFQLEWRDIGEAADGSEQCIVEDGGFYTVYMQAENTDLLFRVNDENQTWSPNVGFLGVDIFNAARERVPSGCESDYLLDELIGVDTVEGLAENGKTFADVKDILATRINTEIGPLVANWSLVPNAWYMLRTKDGPWGYVDDTDEEAYNMSIDTLEDYTDDYEWEALETWDEAACIVETDTLGHLDVYFKTPDLIDGESPLKMYTLRVGDAEEWETNIGEMGFELYEAVAVTDCNFKWVDGDVDIGGTIPAELENGVPGEAETSLLPTGFEWEIGQAYGIKILSNAAWQESEGGADLYTAQISDDWGETWYEFTEYADNHDGICYTYGEGYEIILYIIPETGEEEYRLRVDSESFADNTGHLNYLIALAETVSPHEQCMEGYDPQRIGATWIPVKEENGIRIGATHAMEPGYTYGLRITEGPWFYDENSGEGPGTYSYAAEVSPDDGETWYPLDGTIQHMGDASVCVSMDSTGTYAEFVFTNINNWRIRVADTPGEFDNNGGNLSYDLFLLDTGQYVPDDGDGYYTLNPACSAVCLRPTWGEDAADAAASNTWLQNTGDYLGGWIDYLRCNIMAYFAWCPRHTAIVENFGSSIRTREPFATLTEIGDVRNSVEQELLSYNWDDPSTSTALDSGDFDDYFLNTDDSPWDGGPLVNFSASVPNANYLTTCQTAIPNLMPSIQSGVCLISWHTHNTGLNFWLQIMVDIAAVVFFFAAAAKFSKSVGVAVR